MGWYFAVKESEPAPESGNYRSFGISALQLSYSGYRTAVTVSGVSTDASCAEELARRCTEAQLDPVHLPDVVADFLNS